MADDRYITALITRRYSDENLIGYLFIQGDEK